MTILLTENHPLLSFQADVSNICNAWLPQHGIRFFNFGRMFHDGSCYLLSNDNRVNRYLFETENRLFAPVPAELIKQKFYYLIPSTGPYQKATHDVASFFDIAHGFDLFECHENYTDVCCFATSARTEPLINFYLNNLGQLENFVAYFKDKADKLLTKLNQHKIDLPEHMQLNFRGLIANHSQKPNYIKLGNKRYYLTGKYQHIHFTQREVDCLTKLFAGYTAKETADLCNLSSRTVESYLDNIKSKLGCNRKAEIIAILLKHGYKEFLTP